MISETFTQLLPEMLREGYVCVQRHPAAPLFIYNYTPKAQYERVWNDVTLQCRGLILDGEGAVVARPFRKFFNLEEVGSLPAEPFEVYEKLDGSLGILYWLGDEAYLATRGSFASEQSRRANQILQARYRHVLPRLDRGHTYLFEIIYPENRIVVNYGGREDLVLLAVVDTATGAELPLPEVGFPVVERYDGLTDLATIREKAADNKEGIRHQICGRLPGKGQVCRVRAPAPHPDPRFEQAHLGIPADGLPMERLIEQVPDEFYQWVRGTESRLKEQYAAIEREAGAQYDGLRRQLGDDFSRKDFAALATQYPHPQLLFGLLDGKDLRDRIWKMIEPAYDKPFRNDQDSQD
jgi:RNA ligase